MTAHHHAPLRGAQTLGEPSAAPGASAEAELLKAAIALASHLDLATVLQQFVETAARLTGARFAAMGVLDAYGET